MRMTHYFLGLALLAAPALLATAVTGIALEGGEVHLLVGLLAAIVTVAAHTLMILFMIVTGRVMKAAMQSRPLPPRFLGELNAFFAHKKAYPVSGLAAVSIVAVGVLGYAHRAFGLAPEAHMLLGLAALAFNVWAFALELSVLRENQGLLDRTALALDAIDREREIQGAMDAELAEQPPPLSRGRWLILAGSAWLPYLYWGLIVWKGDFGRIHLLFPVASAVASAAALLAAWGARDPTRARE
jgi:hypothetical protein